VAPVTRLRATAFRQTAAHVPSCTPPAEPAPHAGRYHRPGEPWPLYASLDEATMWAEWGRATGGAVDPADDPRWVCELELDLQVLDLRSAGTRHALSVRVPELTGPWDPEEPNATCLRVAAAAAALGADGFVVPSAARRGGWNVAVLPRAFDRVRIARRHRETPRPLAEARRYSS
jgi:RES domain-containing protein